MKSFTPRSERDKGVRLQNPVQARTTPRQMT